MLIMPILCFYSFYMKVLFRDIRKQKEFKRMYTLEKARMRQYKYTRFKQISAVSDRQLLVIECAMLSGISNVLVVSD